MGVARLTPVSTAEAYAENAPAHFALGPSWLAFCPDPPDICGWSLWGEPSAADVARIVATAEMLRFVRAPVAVFLDMSGLRRADPLTFDALATWIERQRAMIESSITRFALVHGSGMAGAVAAGFFEVVSLSLPQHIFSDRREALEWLDASKADRMLALIEDLDVVQAADPLVGNLATYLELHGASTISQAASTLALSTRSLQRRLKERGTTYQHESDAARVRVAQRLLRDSSASIKRVALEVGCASPKELNRIFKRVLRESPGDWRRRVLSE
jgi:AraC-like DNA-binding protein